MIPLLLLALFASNEPATLSLRINTSWIEPESWRAAAQSTRSWDAWDVKTFTPASKILIRVPQVSGSQYREWTLRVQEFERWSRRNRKAPFCYFVTGSPVVRSGRHGGTLGATLRVAFYDTDGDGNFETLEWPTIPIHDRFSPRQAFPEGRQRSQLAESLRRADGTWANPRKWPRPQKLGKNEVTFKAPGIFVTSESAAEFNDWIYRVNTYRVWKSTGKTYCYLAEVTPGVAYKGQGAWLAMQMLVAIYDEDGDGQFETIEFPPSLIAPNHGFTPKTFR